MTVCVVKFGLFEKHKNLKKFPHGFDKSADLLSKRQTMRKIFFQIICASQKVRSLAAQNRKKWEFEDKKKYTFAQWVHSPPKVAFLWTYRFLQNMYKKSTVKCYTDKSHWSHTMVDGDKFWISYQRPAFLSIFSGRQPF